MAASHSSCSPVPRAGRRTPLVGCLFPLAVLVSCVDATGPPHPLLEEIDFAPELGVDLSEMERIGAGVYIRDLELGHGALLQAPQIVRIDYELYLPDGRHVQTRGDFAFVMGCRQVVRGLEIGVHGMRAGGRRLVVVPARVGYGSVAPWGMDVPPYAPLVFVVDAVSARPAPDAPCRARL